MLSLFPFLHTPYPFRRLLHRLVSSLVFCLISNDCVIIRSWQERLTNPFSAFIIPGLGTILLVSSITISKFDQAFVLSRRGKGEAFVLKLIFSFLILVRVKLLFLTYCDLFTQGALKST